MRINLENIVVRPYREASQHFNVMSMQLRAFRIGIFVAVALATVALVASLVPPYMARNNPSADGLQWVAAVFVVPLYVVLVLPAFILGLVGTRVPLIIATVLLAIAYFVALVILGN